ncbi:uncharacterized protein OCT59_026041 [Rhizophagus irregularis]|uniref:uncharacterized protein n=1 Tax=Rhizophagus irregularis TaxID=588596 RepID=UPI0033231742|nr:hypothetical protein OCT59_026041 [Rhizophagus irregularis]
MSRGYQIKPFLQIINTSIIKTTVDFANKQSPTFYSFIFIIFHSIVAEVKYRSLPPNKFNLIVYLIIFHKIALQFNKRTCRKLITAEAKSILYSCPERSEGLYMFTHYDDLWK